MSSNGILHLSPTNPTSEPHKPSIFEIFDTPKWLDELQSKIERGREKPPPPSPSRSPSPPPRREDDVFGDGDVAAIISQDAAESGSEDGDEANGDDLFGEEYEDEEREDDELAASQAQAGYNGAMAAGILPSSVLEDALRNTERYMPDGDFTADMNGFEDDGYVGRDQAYSDGAYFTGNDNEPQYGVEDEEEDGPVEVGDDEDEDVTHQRAYEDEYADDPDEYDEDEEVDEDDGMGEPLSDENEVIEIGDTDDEEDEKEEEYEEEYENENLDPEEEEQEEVEDDDEEDEEEVADDHHAQGVYGDLYDDLPGSADISGADVPYLSAEIFDALDQQPFSASDANAGAASPRIAGDLSVEPPRPGETGDVRMESAASYGIPEPPIFSPFQFESAAVEEHNAQRSLYPLIPTDTATDLEAILSQPVTSGSGAVSDELIDPELQVPPTVQDSESFLNLPDSSTVSIYPSLPAPASADLAQANSFAEPFAEQEATEPASHTIDVSPAPSASNGHGGEEEENEEEPLFEESGDRSPSPSQSGRDDIIEVLSSDGEEDEEMDEQPDGSVDWLNDAGMSVETPAPAGEEVDELEDDEPDTAPRLPSPTAEEPELVEQAGASPLDDSTTPAPQVQVKSPSTLPSLAADLNVPAPIDFAIPAPAADRVPPSDDVGDEPTPEPLDPRWAFQSSPSIPGTDREQPIPVLLNEVTVEEVEERMPIGLDEMVRQVIAAAEAEVAEPITAQTTPAVDDGLTIAEFFEQPQAEVMEVVEEEMVVVETGIVETPGLATRAAALEVDVGSGPDEDVPEVVTIAEEQIEVIEVIEPIEASISNASIEEEQVFEATETVEPIAVVTEQDVDMEESDDQLTVSQVEVQETVGLAPEPALVVEEAEPAFDFDAASADQSELQETGVQATAAVAHTEAPSSTSAVDVVFADDVQHEDVEAPATIDDEPVAPSPAVQAPAVEVSSNDVADEVSMAVVDNTDEVVVVPPMPKTDISRSSPMATTSTSRAPTRPNGTRASQSPVMPIPILLRSPVHTPLASEDVDMLDDDDEPNVDIPEPRDASPVELPDPHAPVPDTQAPPALSPGEHPNAQVTRSPSIVVEPPLDPPEPETVPAPGIREREETPTLLPDPALPPADATVPLPLSPGQIRDRPTPSPSLIVEPPENPPAPETVVRVPTRENTPVSLPDPHAAPPDSAFVAPLSPHHMQPSDATPTPSIIVEPPTEALTPFDPTSAGGSRADTPPILPDPHAASPDIRRNAQQILDDVPRMAERAASLSPSVQAVIEEDVPASTTAGVFTEESADVSEPAISVVDYGGKTDDGAANDDGDELETTSATSDMTEKGGAAPEAMTRPALFMTESMRLRHHHGGHSSSAINIADLGEPGVTHTATQTHRRTRSTARASTSAVPPVTRSHCFYRKLQLQGNGMSALVLVPQCTLYEPERLEEETSFDLGEATAEEEREAESRAMSEDNPILHPHLALKLHRIVGKAIFDEGHCYLLKADEKALRPADSAEILTVGSHSHPQTTTPKQVKKRAPDEMDDEDDAVEASHSVTRSQARRSKRQSVSRDIQAEGSDALSTPTKNPAPRSRDLRSASRMSEARSDSGAAEIGRSGSSASPVKRTPRATRRSLSVATASHESIDEEAAPELSLASTQESVEEREQTPIVVSVTTTPAGEGARSRRGRKSKQSPVPEETEEAVADAAGEEDLPAVETPTTMTVKTKLSVKPRSSTRRSAAAALEDAPYRPDEADEAELEQEQTEGDDDDEIQLHVEGSGPLGAGSAAGTDDDEAVEAEGAPMAHTPSIEEGMDPPQANVKPPSKKGRKNLADSSAVKSTVERRKSTRLNAKAKEDEAPYRPEDEAESVTSNGNDGPEIEEVKDEEEAASKGKGKGKGTKRKARESAIAAEGGVDSQDAGETPEQAQVEGRSTRSTKRRAVASAQEPDVPVAQDAKQDSDGADVKQEDPAAPATERKSRGWFSLFRMGRK